MSKEVAISNENIRCVISTMGAEIQSVIKDGKEIIWEGDPEVWSGKSPILFPICGGLKDDKYIYEGKEYTLPKHGFGRRSEFEIEEMEQNKVTFLLCSSEETKKNYPFDFEFRITYTLSGTQIKVEYKVTNIGLNDMYFSVGSHEGYACPEGIEEYSIVFEKKETLNSSILNGNLLEYNTICVGENTTVLPLKYEFFAVDALVFLDVKSRNVTLMHKDEKVVNVEFNGADYLLLWTKPTGKYICIEPWCGVPDFEDSDYDITRKRGIICTKSGETSIRTHTLTF